MEILKWTRAFFYGFMMIAAVSGLTLTGCGSGGGGSTDPGSAAVYTVIYNGNGYTGGTPAPQAGYKQGQTVTVPGNTGDLVKNGYTFVGWNTLADGSGSTYTQGQTFTMGTENIDLYAKWSSDPTYTVIYNGNGNTGGNMPSGPANYEQGQTVTVPGNTGGFVNAGYSFTGWNTAADGSGTTYAQGRTFTMGPENVTLYAVWTADPAYTVTYNGNGSTGGIVPSDTTHYLQGQTVTVPGNTGNLSNTGFSFAGWNTRADGGGTTYAPGQTLTVDTQNVTLYAMWATPVYSVTYNGNGNTGGGVPDTTNYQQGQTFTVSGNTGNLVNAGYSFTGWNTRTDGSGTVYTPGQTFTMGPENIRLYAIWTANPTYTVTYNGNGNTGGSVPAGTNRYQQGQTVTVSGNTGSLANASYVFTGWNTQADGSGTTYTQGQTFTMGPANVTLYAKWASSLSEYAYVVNEGDGTVSQYTIVTGGELAPMSHPTVNTGESYGSRPWSVTVGPSGKYAYVANESDGTVSQYTIGADGALTPMSQAIVYAGQGPEAVTVDPLGKFAYVSNTAATTISQYTIGTDGTLTPMSRSTANAVNEPESIAIDPSDRYAYVANEGDSTIAQYTIGTDGSLTQMSPWWVRPIMNSNGTISMEGTVGRILVDGTESVAAGPSDRYVYAANLGNDTVSQFTISPDGELTSMSPVTVAAGSEPWSVAIDPSGRFVYVANKGDGTVSQYTIGAGGTLTPMNPATVPAGSEPISVTVDPSGKFVYVTNEGDKTVSQYTIGAGGALTPMNPATVSAGLYPLSIITTAH